MEQRIIDLYDEYKRDLIDRRRFLKRLALFVGGTAAANALLPLLEYHQAHAAIVPKDDPRLFTDYIKYPGATGGVRAHLARPKDKAKFPAVVVIHENKGLRPHIEDVSRRLAMVGFLAIAPDALTPLGGAPKNAKKAVAMTRKLDKQATLENFLAAVKFIKTHPMSTGKVGVVGFCWGGAMANQLAVHSPDVLAAVPYYGRQPKAKDVPKIKASLLLHYGGLDKRINKGIPAFEAALKAASIDYKMYMYEGAKHAFNNNTRAGRYNSAAARLAWRRTVSFFKKKLK
jgi:carboxymethylenebutenolidase